MKSISLSGKALLVNCACFCFFVLVVNKPKPQPSPKRGISDKQIESTTRGPVIKYLLESFSDETVYC